ncbi:uncharacterized protein Dwil_GK19304 [Drosophila willistoni]|uniref:CBM39 domain-containing protein n=1 Tax=Drosophila willistoni TaxID=7260 RepID=B4MKF7_DROWI|nr:gram-negative bacteria-binding protein 3 [Drosophila willistoni]EDW72596.1 uncharacterized protein Dwil_GK19304 [Drosophila willistoni]
MKSLLLPLVANCLFLFGISYAYQVPEATIRVYSPQGFEVSIPQDPGTSLFAFHGKVNAPMNDLRDQTWAADVTQARNGRWTYINRDVRLNPGDVLYYWTTVRYHGVDHHNYNRRHNVGGGDVLRIDVQGQGGSNQPIYVGGQPTINIYT